MSQDRYRQGLIAIIAAAYQVMDTWEAGDLAGSVTGLGAMAHEWDEALGLGVARRRCVDGRDRGDKDADEGDHPQDKRATQEGKHGR